MHSQTLSTNSNGRFITAVERDSAFLKIQRGKIDALRVKYLDSALIKCDSVKTLFKKALGIEEMKTDTLSLALNKKDIIIKNLELNIEDEVKRGRRRAFWSFLKGTAVGALIISILTIAL